MSLVARFMGIITAPRATYENVVAVPRPFGILFASILLFSVAAIIPQMTESARTQMLEAQVKGMERFGVTVTPEVYQRMEASSKSMTSKVIGIVWSLVMFPILALILTAIFWAFFNAILGGTATFKQVLAVTSHSYVITALGAIAALPVLLIKFKLAMGGPFNLGALAPFLDPASTLHRFLSGVNLFSLWAWANVSIGLAVLYRRSSTTITIVLLIFSLLFTYAMTAIFGSFMGG
ncbi:MAG TPA: YIP1 family protein [Vicinamibacterales bacterium]|nr:YIP1 family protein [Vicinamibacterales bacterium]